MPNWCINQLTITHPDKALLKGFFDKLVGWTSRNYCENGFGPTWLGNIVAFSEIGNPLENNIRCRGSVLDLQFCHDCIVMTTETAWSPCNEMWLTVLEKHLPDAEFIYRSEEPGNGIFVTNDDNYAGYFYIDIFDTVPDWMKSWDGDFIYDADDDCVLQFLQEAFKTDNKNLEELLKKAREDLEWVGIYKWEYVPAIEMN